MQANLQGRVAVVTGGNGAIGRAVALALHREGATLIVADRRHDRVEIATGTAAERWWETTLDVSASADVRRMFETVIAQHGRVDILVNAAGVVSVGQASTLPEAEWDRVLDINLKGTFLCCQAVMPSMMAHGFGRIINIGSVVARNAGNARPWLDATESDKAGNVAYGVSKAGVHVMTGFLAKELARYGVTVNAVAPGPVATAMTQHFPDNLRALIPVGRMGHVDDVARAVCFLAAKDAGFITGEILDVNGGMFCD
ncbi:SDR family NAD(P)-dependent oxidoreductase [Cupriavidus sp. CP313]